MKLNMILTVATILVVSFNTHAYISKFVQELDYKLRSNESERTLNVPNGLETKLTEFGNFNKLSVNGKPNLIYACS